jgi:uncharacterized protein YbbC (DUF1343 family)
MFRPAIEQLVAQDFAPLHKRRVGLLTHPAAVDRQMRSTYHILRAATAVQLTALYAAEHGALGSAQAGETITDTTDTSGIPIYSLYGQTRRPTPEMLANIDVLVCDIQDVGVRYYTYVWTLTHVVEACGTAGIPVLILDRPNPLGDRIAGGGLVAELSSLVGRYDVPVQHGMTIGELLQLHNADWNPTPAALTVLPCDGYTRTLTWAQIDRPFVPTSPNIPHISTVQHYPGACLIEGTTLSEGRGTPLPFEITGAPYIDADALAQRLNALGLAGVRFRPHQFRPTMSKYAGTSCAGVQAHITGADFDALRTWLHVIHTIRHLYPDQFDWHGAFFDKLIGKPEPRSQIDAGIAIDDMIAGWATTVRDFAERRRPYLLYPPPEET